MNKQALQAKVVSLRGQMEDLMKGATKENRELNAEEAGKFDGFNTEIETTKRNIDRLIALEEAGAGNAGGTARGLNGNPNAHIDPESDQGTNPLGVDEKDLAKYSLQRALRCLINNKPVDGLEGEISREVAKRSGKEPQGFYLYGGAKSFAESRGRYGVAPGQRERRDLTLSTGPGALNTTVLYSSFIDILRNKTLIDKIGVRFMAGLNGTILIPRQASAAQAYWLAEEGSPTVSNQVLDQVTLAPNTVGAYTDISRRFIEQTSLDAQDFVMNDLSQVLALEIDRVAFAGTGTSGQPTGILTNGGISIVTAAADVGNGGAVAWGDVVGLETAVANLNADVGNLAYVTNNKQRGKLKQVLRSNVAGATYIWDDNEINGYKAYASSNIPSNLTKGSGTNLSPIIFGDFSSLMVGCWGGTDITVDPYSRSTSGTIRIVALQDVDVEIRHVASFGAITAATN